MASEEMLLIISTYPSIAVLGAHFGAVPSNASSGIRCGRNAPAFEIRQLGIERELENAEREAEKRGLDLKLRDERQRQRLQKGEVNVKGAIERGKVILDLAPKGMHRQVVNKTHWSKAQKCLVWTIEWIDEHGDKTLHLALEKASVQKAHTQMLPEAARSSRKRKHDTDAAGHEGTIPEPRSKHSLDEGNGKDASSTDSVPPSSENLSSPDTYFYLLRPRTPANIRVLAPISAETSITDCLKERVLLEFPTIYVLPFKPDSLPAGFMTEVAFLSQSSADSPTKEAVDHDPEQSTAAADEVVQCGVSQTPVVEV
ncbi:MAG: hypothetical protein M1825_002462 [Sarcosagium campestre]|nr:MAG: hypothetical protein M1825_002462 [Sarcosagium campestre]